MKRLNFFDLTPVSMDAVKSAMRARAQNGAVEEIDPAEIERHKTVGTVKVIMGRLTDKPKQKIRLVIGPDGEVRKAKTVEKIGRVRRTTTGAVANIVPDGGGRPLARRR